VSASKLAPHLPNLLSTNIFSTIIVYLLSITFALLGQLNIPAILKILPQPHHAPSPISRRQPSYETPLNLDFSVQIRQHASSPCGLSTINFIGHSFYITVDFFFFVWPKYLFLPGDLFHQITSTSISLVRFCLPWQRYLFTTSPTLPDATLPLSPHISRSLTVVHTASLHRCFFPFHSYPFPLRLVRSPVLAKVSRSLANTIASQSTSRFRS
jgi:hypothetical protein